MLILCGRRNDHRSLAFRRPYTPPRSGCCGTRLAQTLFQVTAAKIHPEEGPVYYSQPPSAERYHDSKGVSMAGFIAISIGLGVEKLGRTISDKRLVRKEKKTIAQHEAIYGNAESSSSAPAMTTRERQSRTDRKREEAQREFREAHHEQHDVPQYKARRRSLSAERVGEEGPPPPSYDSVVRQDGRRV